MENTRIALVKLTNPFDIEKRESSIVPYKGETLLGLYLQHYSINDPICVSINGWIIPKENYATTLIKPGDSILFKPIITGGGGGGILQIIAGIILVIVAVVFQQYYLLAPAAGLLLGGIAAAITPVPGLEESSGSSKVSQSYSWQPHTLQQQGIVYPILIGTFKLHGNLVDYYTSSNQDKSYLNLNLSLGQGPWSRLYNFYINKLSQENYKSTVVEQRLGGLNQKLLTTFDSIKSEVIVSKKLSYAPKWSSLTKFNINDSVRPTTITTYPTDGTYFFDAIKVYGNSKTGSTEPIWDITPGNTTFDGTQPTIVAGTDGINYVCIKNHTTANDKRPVTGASYSTYWEITDEEANWTWATSYAAKKGNGILWECYDPSYIINSGVRDKMEVEVYFPEGIWYTDDAGNINTVGCIVDVQVKEDGGSYISYTERSSASGVNWSGLDAAGNPTSYCDYQCIKNHTADASNAPASAQGYRYWKYIGEGKENPRWVTGTSYFTAPKSIDYGVGQWSAGRWVQQAGTKNDIWLEVIRGSAYKASHREGEEYYNPSDPTDKRNTWRWITGKQIIAFSSISGAKIFGVATKAVSKTIYIPNVNKNTDYTITCIKLSKNANETKAKNTCYFYKARLVSNLKQISPREVKVGIKALATDQLSGTLDFSCYADGAILAVYRPDRIYVEQYNGIGSRVKNIAGTASYYARVTHASGIEKSGTPDTYDEPGIGSAWNDYWVQESSYDSSCTVWAENITYSQGVIYQSFECIVDHTASSGNKPPNTTYWKPIDCRYSYRWISGRVYDSSDALHYEFNDNNAWAMYKVITQPVLEADEVIGTDNLNYHCIKPHIATATNRPINGKTTDGTNVESQEWSEYWELGGVKGKTWVTGTEYGYKAVRYDSREPDTIDLVKFQELADYADEWVWDGEGSRVNDQAHTATYICLISHTSSASSEPGVGADWDHYWVEAGYYNSLLDTDYTWATSTSYTRGVERRLSFNGVFDSEQSTWDALLQIADVSRCVPIWKGTTISLYIDRKIETIPSSTFCVGNINQDTFSLNYSGLEERASEIDATISDMDNDYEQTRILIPDKTGTLSRKFKANIQPIGITSRGLLRRHGEYRIRNNLYLIRALSIQAKVAAVGCTVGDRCYVQHDVPEWGIGGLIVSGTSTTIVLDKPVVIPANSKILVNVTPTGDADLFEDHPITAGTYDAGDNISLDGATFTVTPKKNDAYYIGTGDYKIYTVMNVSKSSKLDIDLNFIEYNENIYGCDGSDIVSYDFPTTIVKKDYNNYQVVNLKVKENKVVNYSGAIERSLFVNWENPNWADYNGAYVFIKQLPVGTNIGITGTPSVITGTDGVNYACIKTYVVNSENLSYSQPVTGGIYTNWWRPTSFEANTRFELGSAYVKDGIYVYQTIVEYSNKKYKCIKAYEVTAGNIGDTTPGVGGLSPLYWEETQQNSNSVFAIGLMCMTGPNVGNGILGIADLYGSYESGNTEESNTYDFIKYGKVSSNENYVSISKITTLKGSSIDIKKQTPYAIKVCSLNKSDNYDLLNSPEKVITTSGDYTPSPIPESSNTLRISHLQVNSQGNSGICTSINEIFTWGKATAAISDNYGAGQEPSGAGAFTPGTIKGYQIQIFDSLGIRRTDFSPTESYIYTYEMNKADGNGTSIRDYTIEVRVIDLDNVISMYPQRIEITHPIPVVRDTDISCTNGMKKFTVNITPSTDNSVVTGGEYKIYASKTSGFTPSSANLINTGAESSYTHEISASDIGTWYIKTAIADCFYNPDIDTLNYSTETSTVVPLVVYTDIGSVNADTITVGSIRGINIQGSSHMTKGSYLITTCLAADTTLYLKDTVDFASSGTAFIIDSANDHDTITYTGKTSTTLTGVTGVLAHTVSSTNIPVVIPAIKSIVIADVTNEMRFYGDRGDGTIEELASIGISNTFGLDTILNLGSVNSTRRAIHTEGTVSGIGNNTLIYAKNHSPDAARYAIMGVSYSSTGAGIYGSAAGVDGNGGWGGIFEDGISINSGDISVILGNIGIDQGVLNLSIHEHGSMPSGTNGSSTCISHNTAWTYPYQLAYLDGSGVWRKVIDNTTIS